MSSRTVTPALQPQIAGSIQPTQPGRLLVLSLREEGGSAAGLESVADVAMRAANSGWRVEWIQGRAHPAGLGDRQATIHPDAAEQVAAAHARMQARNERERVAALPPRRLRRLEDWIVKVKHAPNEGGALSGTCSRLAARIGLRFVRPLRKLQDRLFPRDAPPLSGPTAESVGDPSGSHLGATYADLAELLADCGPTDIVLLTAAEPRHLEWMLGLVPALGQDRPVNSTLLVRFAVTDLDPVANGEVDLETLARRWATGAPFRHTFFQAENAAAAAARTVQTGFPVSRSSLDLHQVTHRAIAASGQRHPQSVDVEEFGPVALQVTAMCGRGGKTSIFDSQARYLVHRGFLLVRILLDHWPHSGDDRRVRIDAFVRENLESIRPHAWVVVERDVSTEHAERVQGLREFANASTLERMMMLMAEPTVTDARSLAWAARAARIAVVNQLPHVMFTERLTRAPIVLETHGIFTNLLLSRGVPGFVPPNPKDVEAQLVEEKAVFARVGACVCLSAEDEAVVSRHARISRVIRPHASPRELVRRSWPKFVLDNQLDGRFLAGGHFDVMLWGDWHEGNVEGIQWFLEKVMPCFERLRRARVVIAGRVSGGLPKGLAEAAGILVAGFVDRLDDLILRTKVLLVPDQGGTGISIKAMDALALGRAFVSTPAGMRNLDLGDMGYVAHDDPVEFGREVLRLLASRAARDESGATARRLYERNFCRAAYSGSWDAVVAAVAPDALAAAHRGSIKETALPRMPNPAPRPAPMQDLKGRVPRISIIICTYNRYDVLPDAIASALSQDLPPGDFEVLVVDNSPDQAVAKRWSDDYADEPVVRYHLEPVPGLSNARNVGTDLARAPVVAFMDDDAVASPHWARELLEAFAAFPNAGMVGGRVRPRWVGEQGASWLHKDCMTYLSVVDWGDERRPMTDREWSVGCNVAYVKEVLLKSGGFSRSLGRVGSGASLLSNEETDVATRIHELGRISVYAPKAEMEHVIDPSRLTREWFRKRAAWQAVSDLIKNPQSTVEYSARAKQRLRQVLEGGKRRVPLGAFHDTNDKDTFKDDMDVIYYMVIACLTGGFELPPGTKR